MLIITLQHAPSNLQTKKQTHRNVPIVNCVRRYIIAQVRNQGGHLGLLPPPKFSKHCIALLTILQKRSKNKDEIFFSNRFKEKL